MAGQRRIRRASAGPRIARIKLIIRRSEVQVLPAPRGNAVVTPSFRLPTGSSTTSAPRSGRTEAAVCRETASCGPRRAARPAVHVVREQVAVQVQGRPDARMAELSLNGLGVRALDDQERSIGVLEAVGASVARQAQRSHGWPSHSAPKTKRRCDSPRW
jgi:hypothetical protein